MIRLGKQIKASRIGQLMTRVIGAFSGGGERPRVWRGLGLFLEKQVRADDAGLLTVYEHFRSNLESIIDHAAGSGAAVACCTVACNLKDCPPFASQHRTDLSSDMKEQWERLYASGTELEKRDPDRAIVSYLAAAAIDETHADLQFRLGECYWTLGEFEKARQHYVRARDLDTLRFRADTRINEIIRDVVAGRRDEGVVLVDAEKALGDQSRRGIPGREFFHEHVHMTFKGNDVLARALLAAVEDLLPRWIRNRRGPAAGPPDEAAIAADLAYNDWALRRIKVKMCRAKSSEAPFTNQLYLEERVERMRAELREIETRLNKAALERIALSYRRLIGQRPEDWLLREKHAEFLLECGDHARAAEQEYERIVAGLPHHYNAWAQLGILKGRRNDLDGAIEACREAIRLQPYSADAHYTLGLSYQKTGKTDAAIDSYSRVVEVRPSYGPAWNNLAGLTYSQGRVDEAIATYRRGLEILPESVELHYNLGELFKREKRRAEAIAEFEAALAIDPSSARARRALEGLR
jgi:tetratricopeptide (TPR) repeat protein